MGAAPVPLSYDDLPPGSDIRRSHDPDGTLRITIPAGELTPPVLRRVWHEALVHSAITCAAILFGTALVFLWALRIHGTTGWSLIFAWLGFGVGCGAFVLLLASARYAFDRGALEIARRQNSVIAISADRLVVESTGPLGTFSDDVEWERIRSARPNGGLWTDAAGRIHALRYVLVELTDGPSLRLAPGRDSRELVYITDAICSATPAGEARP
jgi:hypothetical protein